MEEEVKNEDIFAKAEDASTKTEKQQTLTTEEAPVQEASEDLVDDEQTDSESDDLIDEDFSPVMNDKSQAQIEEEKGVKKNMDGKVLTIKSVEVMPPKTKKMVDGTIVKIDPQLTQAKKAEFYSTKMKIRFEEENIVEYVPSIRVWVNDGKLNPNIKLDRVGNSKVSQLIRLALYTMKPGKFELVETEVNEKKCLVVSEKTKPVFDALSKLTSDVEILEWMVGRKCKIKTATGTYNGLKWFRNDIIAFSKD